jgi:hypothetical protein
LPALAGSVYNLPRMEKGYCGLDCSSCPGISDEFPSRARELKKTVVESDMRSWAPSMPGGNEIDFDNLGYALDWIIQNGSCRGCMEGGGPPGCVIRQCAREKNLENCVSCSSLEPCEKFGWLPPEVKEKLLAEKRGGT